MSQMSLFYDEKGAFVKENVVERMDVKMVNLRTR
jgi:hypothetical protein